MPTMLHALILKAILTTQYMYPTNRRRSRTHGVKSCRLLAISGAALIKRHNESRCSPCAASMPALGTGPQPASTSGSNVAIGSSITILLRGQELDFVLVRTPGRPAQAAGGRGRLGDCHVPHSTCNAFARGCQCRRCCPRSTTKKAHGTET